MRLNPIVQGSWLALTVASAVAISSGELNEIVHTILYVVCLASVVGWAMTRHVDGWLGTPPTQLRKYLQWIEEDLEYKDKELDEETLRSLQKRRKKLRKELSEAREAGFID